MAPNVDTQGKPVEVGGETCRPTRTQQESLRAIVRDVLHQRINDPRRVAQLSTADTTGSSLSSGGTGSGLRYPGSSDHQQRATEFKNHHPGRETMSNPEFKTGADNVLTLLNNARKLADSCGRNPWDFALEIAEFTDRGIGRNVLRFLVWQGLIEHRTELTAAGEAIRSFQKQDLALSSRSCFVLTDSGRQAVYSNSSLSLGHNVNTNPNGGPPEERNDRERRMQPYWDENLRELKLGEQVVKRFKWPAANQERVIRAFQEEGWPVKIDDPLPPSNDVCPKRRLHDTIKCLNRKQVCGAIRFRGDGTGQGVMIEIIPEKMDQDSE
ncbi:MAG: hypothetical protein AAF456_04510 [Planctomycetota bacterium]